MKIINYVPTASFIVGGGEIVPIMQAQFLAKLGHKVTFVTVKPPQYTDFYLKFKKTQRSIDFIEIDNYKTKIVEPYTHEFHHELHLSLSRQIGRICNRIKPSRVIVHYTPAIFGIPEEYKSLLILHGVPSEYSTTNQAALNSASILSAVSRSVKIGWKKLHKTRRSIRVLHNGIDEKYFQPSNLEKDIDVFYVGRLIEIKGVQYLIKAIHTLNRKDLNVIIGGKGPYLKDLELLVEKYNLKSQVKLIGYVPDRQLLSYYHRAKMCVFPSYAKEGVLTTLLEAASCSVPVITSNCCGMVDFVKDKSTGLLVEPKSFSDIAKKIKLLLDNKDLREKVGKRARSSVLRNWTWEKSTKKLIKLLRSIS